MNRIFIMEPFLWLVMTLHIIVTPFTKVEESFNMQAVHDILYHGFNMTNYDHFEFPGVVPRTFIGPLIVALCSYPVFIIGYFLGWKKFTMVYLVRFLFGVLGLQALRTFMRSVYDRFGLNVVIWAQILTCTQFHYLFYISRTLPNIFALSLVTIAYFCWLERYHRGFVFSSAAAIIIFRGELCIILGIILLYELLAKRVDLKSVVMWGITDAAFLLTLTVSIDSVFWRRFLWPEGEVLWFNLVLNKSSEWGTLPFLWYFYSAIPRSMLLSVFFMPFGCWLDKRIRPLVFIALLYVLIYSFLPHKELRFIIYVIPLLNVSAARTYAYLWNNRLRSGFLNILCFLAIVSLLVNLFTTFLMLNISTQTYPGGRAMARLHELERGNDDVNVYFDSFAAQTGVTHFSELNPKWRYNKTEGLDPEGVEMMAFTHLLIEHPGKNMELPYRNSHVAMEIIHGYYKWNIKPFGFPPLDLFDRPYIVILKRKSVYPTVILKNSNILSYKM